MSQRVQMRSTVASAASAGKEHGAQRLGAFLCWAVVFADIGTSVYYTPGILYGQVNRLAGLFVLMTMVVFILLVLKYSEVSVRFPEGGGVVTVSAHALNPWAGAVGGMFILVDYFLTASISSLSGLQYFSALFPHVAPFVLIGAIIVLVFLGILNWWGIKESATVSAVIALAALASDILIILLVLFAYTPGEILLALTKMFSGTRLTGLTVLTGFAGAFLAFSGLESISQLSPVMRVPRSKTVTRALALVVITVGITSPLLTIFSTVLLTTPLHAAHGIPAPFNTVPANPDQFISELARAYGGRALEVVTAIAASALLIFASNTAIIGSYHVLLALSRMRFFPEILQRMSKVRGTPHVAILLAACIPMLVLVAVRGSIQVLGSLYAFGLLGAFVLTCLSLDVIRWRERHRDVVAGYADWDGGGAHGYEYEYEHEPVPTRGVWPDIRYYLGFLTTLLVALAWIINLFSKPDATLFGGGLTLLGVGIAVVNYRHQERMATAPVFPMSMLYPMPHALLVVLPAIGAHNLEVVRAAAERAHGRRLIFVYLAERGIEASSAFQFADPYLYDESAQRLFSRAARLCQRARVPASFIYRVGGLDRLVDVWRAIQPDEIVMDAQTTGLFSKNVSPAYVRYSDVDGIRLAHYVRHHLPQEESSQTPDDARKSRPSSPPRPLRPGSLAAAPIIPEVTTLAPTRPETGEEPSSLETFGGEASQNPEVDEWVWTGTDLVRRDQASQDDEASKS